MLKYTGSRIILTNIVMENIYELVWLLCASYYTLCSVAEVSENFKKDGRS